MLYKVHTGNCCSNLFLLVGWRSWIFCIYSFNNTCMHIDNHMHTHVKNSMLLSTNTYIHLLTLVFFYPCWIWSGCDSQRFFSINYSSNMESRWKFDRQVSLMVKSDNLLFANCLEVSILCCRGCFLKTLDSPPCLSSTKWFAPTYRGGWCKLLMPNLGT